MRCYESVPPAVTVRFTVKGMFFSCNRPNEQYVRKRSLVTYSSC